MFKIELDVDDVGIDYLRLKGDSEEGKAWIWEAWNDHLEATEGASVNLTPKRTSRGRSLTWSNMGVMWQKTGPSWLWASGAEASMLANRKDISLLSSSRVDIQVSGSVSGGGLLNPARLYHWWTDQTEGKVARMGCTLVQSKTGQTCYLGGRSAPRFLRVYDKGAQMETHPHGRYLRVELELKRDLASDWFDEWVESNHRDALVSSTLVQYLASVNVQGRFGLPPTNVRTRLKKRIQTPQSMIEWLESSVRPVVMRLNRQGYNSDVMRALGLQSNRE